MRSIAGPVRRLSISTAVGVILVATFGCTTTRSNDGLTGTSTSPPPPPMTQAEYQGLLTGAEQAIRPVFDQFIAAATPADADAARIRLIAAVDAQHNALESVEPPADADRAHRLVLGALSIGTSLRGYVPKAPQPNSCGVAPAVETQLYEIKRDVYSSLKSNAFTTAVTGLAELDLTFGELMFPPEPAAPPPPAARRAGNGEVVQRAGPRGRGRLMIKNGSDGDVAVLAVIQDPAAPMATIYVHGGANATLTGLSGTYFVYFKTGSDWDPGRRGFTQDCAFEKFDQSFDRGSDWEISLQKTIGGNASTSTVPPF